MLGERSPPFLHRQHLERDRHPIARAADMLDCQVRHQMAAQAQLRIGQPGDPGIERPRGRGGEREEVAGYVHIGTAPTPPLERARPDVAAITSRWSPA